jgi:type IV pilus assembly protein PilA
MCSLLQRMFRRRCNRLRTDGDSHDGGFTLIELMVVVLIIAILLAIAIPTFLGARNSANARSMQSNLRNALTTEQTQYTNTQSFASNLATIEPSLSWGTGEATTKGGNVIFVSVLDSGQQAVIQGYANDGNCYEIFVSNDSSSFPGTAYDSSASSCTTPPSIPTATVTTPGNGVIGAHGSFSWNTSW